MNCDNCMEIHKSTTSKDQKANSTNVMDKTSHHYHSILVAGDRKNYGKCCNSELEYKSRTNFPEVLAHVTMAD